MLVGALRGMPHASFSAVTSDGRLMSTLVDYTDGSSYEVICCSDSALLVVPQYRATAQSLDRLCEQILTGFREGEVVDCE
jgi:hypothetical protein